MASLAGTLRLMDQHDWNNFLINAGIIFSWALILLSLIGLFRLFRK
jgi:hypothetical protein